MATADSISSAETLDMSAALSDIIKRINQVRGIVDVIGSLDMGSESLDQHGLNNATWAAKDLLDDAQSLAEKLFHRAVLGDNKQDAQPA